MTTDDFWAVTAYYNPAGYRSRRLNYRIFRSRLTVPLLTVELSATDRFELGAGDAEIHLPLRGDARIWQKERLLNLGIAALPAAVRYVAWLDADIVFRSDDWPERARRAIDAGAAAVQLFDRALHLTVEGSCRLAEHGAWHTGEVLLREESFAAALARGAYDAAGSRPTRTESERGPVGTAALPISHGQAWAGARERIGAGGLYDACIIGGGDTATALGYAGLEDRLTGKRAMTTAQIDHYGAWNAALAGDRGVAAIEETIAHLRHGRFERRFYSDRHRRLAAAGFDPVRHLARAANGTWQWTAAAAEPRAVVRRYFDDRREDSEAPLEPLDGR